MSNKVNGISSSPNAGGNLDLVARAHAEMVKSDFVPDFEPAVKEEMQSIISKDHKLQQSGKDLRSLLWSSIDNPDSKDLDQVEYCERLTDGSVRTMIAIADVDSFVAKGSAIDKHAYTNTTSVYTGVITYPMLPDQLSFDLTSLIANEDREAIIIDLVVDTEGDIIKSDVYSGIIRNHAKLDYKTVGTWLTNGGSPPAQINSVPGLAEQILLQSDVKQRIYKKRKEKGALYLSTIEAIPITANGEVLDLELVEDNPARDLIENFMVVSNIAVSHSLEEKQSPSIKRIVKTPERWDKIVQVAALHNEILPAQPDAKALAVFLLKQKEADPERFADLSLTIVKLLGRGEYVVEIPGQKDAGHFALAVRDYTHATAPNRRYPDLIMQRLLKGLMAKQAAPYKLDELNKIAAHCTERENAAKKVERTMSKIAAAVFLSKHIGETYQGIITGVTDGGTYVRIFKPPVEGKIVEGAQGLDVGDKVKVKLVSTDPERAFIDFAYIKV
jgi:VacB/RNase II family 3'-5' exoribonuclease